MEQEHAEETKVNDVPCPRCGCWLTRHFACNCGAVHSDYCVNCGRFTELARTEHTELADMDAPCERGPVMHEHPIEEKLARIDASIELARRARSN